VNAATQGQAARGSLELRVRQAIASAGRCTAQHGKCTSCGGEVGDVMEIADHYAEAARQPQPAPELAALRELLDEIGVMAANAPEDGDSFGLLEEIAMRIAAAGVPDEWPDPENPVAGRTPGAAAAPGLAADGSLSGHVTVRFPAGLIAAAGQVAASEGMTVSAWIRREVEREAARREQPAPEPASAMTVTVNGRPVPSTSGNAVPVSPELAAAAQSRARGAVLASVLAMFSEADEFGVRRAATTGATLARWKHDADMGSFEPAPGTGELAAFGLLMDRAQKALAAALGRLEATEAAREAAEAELAAWRARAEAEDFNDGSPVRWSDACAPGGMVCAVPDPSRPDGICGVPMESEPCGEHAAGQGEP
jgi:hypothetical protein